MYQLRFYFLSLLFLYALGNASMLLSGGFSGWVSDALKSRKLGGDTPYRTSFATPSTPYCKPTIKQFATFSDWQKVCNQLPRFHKSKRNQYATPLSETLFEQELEQFFSTVKKQHNALFWINDATLADTCTDFQTYAEKLIIPNDATVAIHGDIHGDIHGINRFITFCAEKGFMDKEDSFKITDKNFYMLFLGDYVDRGWYGVEVIYTIMRLKNENPNQVFMVRGNHEDINLNKPYGFLSEFSHKFGSSELFQKVHTFYNKLPAVLYLGAGKKSTLNFIQCCHGGIEIGFDPHTLLEDRHHHAGMLINDLMQQTMITSCACAELDQFKKYFHNAPISANNGFMWNDFIVNPNVPFALSARDGYQGSMFDYGQSVTRKVLDMWKGTNYQVHSIFRAHQQGDPEMRERILNLDNLSHPDDTGMGKLWIENSIHQSTPGRLDDVAAITFSLAPDTGYGYHIHAFGLLKVAEEYKDWRLEVIRAPYAPAP